MNKIIKVGVIGAGTMGAGIAGQVANAGIEVWLLDLPTDCLLYTSPSPRDATLSRMPSSA